MITSNHKLCKDIEKVFCGEMSPLAVLEEHGDLQNEYNSFLENRKEEDCEFTALQFLCEFYSHNDPVYSFLGKIYSEFDRIGPWDDACLIDPDELYWGVVDFGKTQIEHELNTTDRKLLNDLTKIYQDLIKQGVSSSFIMEYLLKKEPTVDIYLSRDNIVFIIKEIKVRENKVLDYLESIELMSADSHDNNLTFTVPIQIDLPPLERSIYIFFLKHTKEEIDMNELAKNHTLANELEEIYSNIQNEYKKKTEKKFKLDDPKFWNEYISRINKYLKRFFGSINYEDYIIGGNNKNRTLQIDSKKIHIVGKEYSEICKEIDSIIF